MGQSSGIHPVVHAIVAANCGGREEGQLSSTVPWCGMAWQDVERQVPLYPSSRDRAGRTGQAQEAGAERVWHYARIALH